MSEEFVNIEINGTPLQARKGAMVIEVADQAGIVIPRFCYHEKLSVAANCRMCLVEVEKAPKPLPACATPVMDGMKVHTQSPRAIAAQKGTMEFLLINHPLDCPICDQGGECELQDVAMGFGGDVSRYSEGKRVVFDKDIGPLIATEMTRCIHCTRCVRFGAELAGVRELGATGRGEHTLIGTYIEKSVSSELSGNVIDLCPVGALTARPSRFRARAWEMTRHAGVAPHDSLGSNLHFHCRGDEVVRVAPRDNEAINECWLSDRDRFSYQGLYSEDRLTRPLVKRDGQWRECDWEEALERAVEILKGPPGDALGALVSPRATLEEIDQAVRIARGLGCNHIDHRLRQGDFSGQDHDPVFPGLGMDVAGIERLDAALVIGSNIRKEQPLLAMRLRKAVLAGASAMMINAVDYDLHFPLARRQIVAPQAMVGCLAGIARALLEANGKGAPGPLAELIDGSPVNESQRAMAETLKAGGKAVVWLGVQAIAHAEYATLRSLAALIARESGASLGYLAEAANSAGACLAGALPHRDAGGRGIDEAGLDARAMLEQPRQAYLLVGIEPARDCWDPVMAMQALTGAAVVALSSYRSSDLEACADVLLPMAAFAETSGTFVNLEGRWQDFRGVMPPPGEARPGWKILRVLGNLLGLEGFEHESSDEISRGLRERIGEIGSDNRLTGYAVTSTAGGSLWRVGDVPPYAMDAVVRRAEALQRTPDAVQACVRLHPDQIHALKLNGAGHVRVNQGEATAVLPLEPDARVPMGAAWIPAGVKGSEDLGPQSGEITLAWV